MPFKPGKSPADVNKELSKKITTEIPNNIQMGLYSMYQVLSATADNYVPVDTTDLVKSKSFRIENLGAGQFRMTYGYYTEYARYLHESFDWSPRPVGAPGKRGTQWNPNAKPKWLDLAWQESGKKSVEAFKAKL